MPPKIALTKRSIEALKPPKQGDRTYHYDAKTPGLCVCVSSTGAKAFYLYKKILGRPQRIKLGSCSEITVENARKAAAMALAEIAQGGNPQEKRRKARAVLTLGELFDWYLENHAKPHKRTWAEDQKQFDRYLSEWKSRRTTSISKADVQALHNRIGDKHGKYAANRLRSLLHTLFSKAADVGYEKANPAAGVKRFKEQSRERYLRADELPAFFAALANEPSDTGRDFIMLSLLTGARRRNVMEMRWADVRLDRAEWRIPDTKTGEPLLVPLVAQAVQILSNRWAAAQTDKREKAREWVFPGRGASGHLMDPTKPWKSVLERAGLSDVRIHDLRRTLGSWQAATGASLPVIGKSLGHKHAATTSIYARLGIDPVRQSVTAATAAILAHIPEPKEGEEDGQA